MHLVIWLLVIITVIVLAYMFGHILLTSAVKSGAGELVMKSFHDDFGMKKIHDDMKRGGAAMLEQITNLAEYKQYVEKNSPALKIGQVVFGINNELWISGINYFQKNLSKVTQKEIRTGGAMPPQKVDTIEIGAYTIVNPQVPINGKFVPLSAIRQEDMKKVYNVIDNKSPNINTKYPDDYTIYIKYDKPHSLDGIYYIFGNSDEQQLLDDLGVPLQAALAPQAAPIPAPPPMPLAPQAALAPIAPLAPQAAQAIPEIDHHTHKKRTYVKKINIAVNLGKTDEIMEVMRANYAKLDYDISMEDFVYGEMEKNDLSNDETFLKTYIKYILKAKTLITTLISSDEISKVILSG